MTPVTAETPASASSASSREPPPDPSRQAQRTLRCQHETHPAVPSPSARARETRQPARPRRGCSPRVGLRRRSRRDRGGSRHRPAAAPPSRAPSGALPRRGGPVHCPQRLALTVLADAVRLRATGEGERSPPSARSAPTPVDERRGELRVSWSNPKQRPYRSRQSRRARARGVVHGQHSQARRTPHAAATAPRPRPPLPS